MDDAHGPMADCETLGDLDADAELREVLSLFGKKHTLAIMYAFAFSEAGLRFSELESRLDVSSTTLSNRLAELTEEGFLERHSYDEIPPRVEYVATAKTHALTPVFEDLYAWAEAHAGDAEQVAAGDD